MKLFKRRAPAPETAEELNARHDRMLSMVDRYTSLEPIPEEEREHFAEWIGQKVAIFHRVYLGNLVEQFLLEHGEVA